MIAFLIGWIIGDALAPILLGGALLYGIYSLIVWFFTSKVFLVVLGIAAIWLLICIISAFVDKPNDK